MNLELNLMELNSLYMAVSNQLKVAQKEAKQYPSDFFETQLVLAQSLVEKVQDALWSECKVVDDSISRLKTGKHKFQTLDETLSELESDIRAMNTMDELDGLELELEALEDERIFYASVGDWDRCEFIQNKIEDVKEDIKELKEEYYASTSK